MFFLIFYISIHPLGNRETAAMGNRETVFHMQTQQRNIREVISNF